MSSMYVRISVLDIFIVLLCELFDMVKSVLNCIFVLWFHIKSFCILHVGLNKCVITSKLSY